jgi:hypothetical protein
VIGAFPILGQSSAAAEPGECAFDDPAFGQRDEACGLTRPLENLDVEVASSGVSNPARVSSSNRICVDEGVFGIDPRGQEARQNPFHRAPQFRDDCPP